MYYILIVKNKLACIFFNMTQVQYLTERPKHLGTVHLKVIGSCNLWKKVLWDWSEWKTILLEIVERFPWLKKLIKNPT
jgi:hypothetical protein